MPEPTSPTPGPVTTEVPSSSHGPPPPPTPMRVPSDDQTPRTAAVTWVAATGALLLLVAAGTFLAVSWDVLGITARVAVVATITSAAIVGGHRLRSALPAVGAVIYHLGALLLPVDAIGLALQLDLSTAAAWVLTGVVAVIALPPLAIAGRSRVLAVAAVLGVPVLATGVGLTGAAAPSLLVVGIAVVCLALLPLRGTRVAMVWRGAPVALAVTSVLLPLAAAVVDITLAEGQIVGHIRDAGWAPVSWVIPSIVGLLAVTVVGVCARVRRSARLAALAPALAAVAAIVAVLPAGTPRLAMLLILPVLGLIIELAALMSADDPIWSKPLRGIAVVAEALAALAVVEVFRMVAAPDLFGGTSADPELAAAMAVVAIAWIVAALRRRVAVGGTPILIPLLVGVASLHAAAVVALALPGNRAPAAAVLLMVTAAAFLAWPRSAASAPAAAEPDLTAAAAVAPSSRASEAAYNAGVAPGQAPQQNGLRLADLAGLIPAATATVLIAMACVAAWGTLLALPFAAIAAPLIGAHLRVLLTEGQDRTEQLAIICLPFAIASSVLLALVPGSIEPGSFGNLDVFAVQVAIAVAAMFVLALTVDRLPAVADTARVAGVAVLLIAFTPASIPAAVMADATTFAQEFALAAIRPVPALLLALVPALVWLTLDAARLRRPLIGLLIAPIAVRGLVSAGAALGFSPVVIGIVLLVAAVISVAVLVAAPRSVGDAFGLFAGLAAFPGWALIGATPLARSLALVALGLVGVIIGVARRNGLIGHLGGAVATVGIWLLLDLYGLNAVDLWMLPVALQLVVAGDGVRRNGTVSSWAVDVPPLLLVAIPALSERLTGGPGYHAVIAGGVALVAIVFGGARGRGGPLTTGIIVVLAVVAVETVAFAALVPTWAWFAVAGSVLLGSAVLIERNGLTPTAAVGRLKDLAADADQEAID